MQAAPGSFSCRTLLRQVTAAKRLSPPLSASHFPLEHQRAFRQQSCALRRPQFSRYPVSKRPGAARPPPPRALLQQGCHQQPFAQHKLIHGRRARFPPNSYAMGRRMGSPVRAQCSHAVRSAAKSARGFPLPCAPPQNPAPPAPARARRKTASPASGRPPQPSARTAPRPGPPGRKNYGTPRRRSCPDTGTGAR